MKALMAGLICCSLCACSGSAARLAAPINYVDFETILHHEQAPEPVAGKVGLAGQFHQSRISFPAFERVQEHTVAAWVFVPDLGDGPYPMLIMEKSSAYYMNILTRDGKWQGRKGHLRVGWHYSDGTQQRWEYLDSPTPAPLNQWFHAAYTQKNGLLTLYINGEQVAEKSILPILLDTDQELTWGALWKVKEQRYKWWFKGKLDEGMVFNRALTAEEIKQLSQQR